MHSLITLYLCHKADNADGEADAIFREQGHYTCGAIHLTNQVTCGYTEALCFSAKLIQLKKYLLMVLLIQK